IVETLRSREVGAIVTWYADRARAAFDAGLHPETHYGAQLLQAIGRARPDAALPLAQVLRDDSEIGSFASAPLLPLFEDDIEAIAPLLREWLGGDARDRALVWWLLIQNPTRVLAVAPQLVREALAAAQDVDAHLVEIFLIRIAGQPGDAVALGVVLR